jgi:hypothetical protein
LEASHFKGIYSAVSFYFGTFFAKRWLRLWPTDRCEVKITQFNPPLPLKTSKGSGLAHFVIDYGPESHLMWVVFLDADGACWTVPNPEIRMAPNWSFNRRPAPQGRDAAKRANGPDGIVNHPALRTR